MPPRAPGVRPHDPRRDQVRGRPPECVGDRPGRRRAGLGGRCRRLRRSARSSARARPPAEGRPCQDIDPGAGGSVPQLHRGGAQAPARAGGRLPRDGRLARLFEIAAVAARYQRARGAERGGYGDRACAAAQAPGSHPRCCRAPVRARPARSRRVPPRTARADRPRQAPAMDGDALRSALGLCPAAAKDGAFACAARQAHRLVTG